MTHKTEREIDALIRDALSEEEAAHFDQLGEPSLTEMVTDLYRGRNRWLVVITSVVIVVFFGLALYTGWRFYHAPEVREMLLWGGACFFCFMAVMGNKLWHWMEMERNAIVREIKRLELQVAHLAAELKARQ